MGKVSKRRSSGSVLLSRNRSSAVPSVKPPTSLSSKAGRTLIRNHHTLQKQLAQAVARNDTEAAQKLRHEIEASGGLEKYQNASIHGQSSQRGGDSSKLLIQWLNEDKAAARGKGSLKLLEVGSLSPNNAVSKYPLFTVTRIDLHSQHPCIETQDFMERPLPTSEDQKFDLISLSLVLNYVPDPADRGEMLRRTTQYLRTLNTEDPLFPSLFLVLPAPCVTNSRYLNEKRLGEMMESLGYTLVKRKLSPKLIYGLWRLNNLVLAQKKTKWKKEEVNAGKTRNNFAVTFK
ncbi:putative methyltransferase-domain-containing protein [Trichophaea hybrida]|nr:putative methyltransferase-domain-containing protein [Trichophaea hybrida]